MIISTKYKIGDEVYIVYKVNDYVIVRKDKIKEILVKEDDDISYYLEDFGDEAKEEELIDSEYYYDLKDKVVELLNGCEDN